MRPFTIRIPQGNSFVLHIPLVRRSYIGGRAVDVPVDITKTLTDISVTVERLGESDSYTYHVVDNNVIAIAFPAGLPTGVYSIRIAAMDIVSGAGVASAYKDAFSIVGWNIQSNWTDFVPGSPILLPAVPYVDAFAVQTPSLRYDKSSKTITLYIGEQPISTLDVADFIKDGMVSDVEVVGKNIVITFNTDAEKRVIEVPTADIFNPDNYYQKTDVDEKEEQTNKYTDIKFAEAKKYTDEARADVSKRFLPYSDEDDQSKPAQLRRAVNWKGTEGGSLKLKKEGMQLDWVAKQNDSSDTTIVSNDGHHLSVSCNGVEQLLVNDSGVRVPRLSAKAVVPRVNLLQEYVPDHTGDGVEIGSEWTIYDLTQDGELVSRLHDFQNETGFYVKHHGHLLNFTGDSSFEGFVKLTADVLPYGASDALTDGIERANGFFVVCKDGQLVRMMGKLRYGGNDDVGIATIVANGGDDMLNLKWLLEQGVTVMLNGCGGRVVSVRQEGVDGNTVILTTAGSVYVGLEGISWSDGICTVYYDRGAEELMSIEVETHADEVDSKIDSKIDKLEGEIDSKIEDKTSTLADENTLLRGRIGQLLDMMPQLTAYALYFDDDMGKDLIFLASTKTYEAGGLYAGREIVRVYSGEQITNRQATEAFESGVEHVVFDWTFRAIRPKRMLGWFYRCEKLTSVDMGGLDTSDVVTMRNLFYDTRVAELDFTGCDTSGVTDMQYVFGGCPKLRAVYGTLDVSGANSMYRLTEGTNAIHRLRLTGFGTRENMSETSLLGRLGDSSVYPDALDALRSTLVTESFDRASAGYVACRIHMSQYSVDLLTEDELETISNKGYTIAIG